MSSEHYLRVMRYPSAFWLIFRFSNFSALTHSATAPRGLKLTFVFDFPFARFFPTDANGAAGVQGWAVGKELAEARRGDVGEPVAASVVLAQLQAVLLGWRSWCGQNLPLTRTY